MVRRSLILLGALALASLAQVGDSRSEEGKRAVQDPLGTSAWEQLPGMDAPAARAEAIAAALAIGDALEPEHLNLAFQAGIEEAAALRLDNARVIQAALHERVQATWSAMNVSLTLARQGDDDAAEAVLEAQLERARAGAQGATRTPDERDLLGRYALLALGRGDRPRALDRLGRALAAGSPDAAIVLGRLHLEARNTTAARALFRARVKDPEPGAWALRGWGLTLIDPPESP